MDLILKEAMTLAEICMGKNDLNIARNLLEQAEKRVPTQKAKDLLGFINTRCVCNLAANYKCTR